MKATGRSSIDAKHYMRVVWTVGWSDFVQKYRRSIGGYILSFGTLLLRFLVIGYVFRGLLSQEVSYYGFYLFIGLIVWEFFTGTTRDCMNAPRRKKSLIERLRLPRTIYPLAAGVTNGLVLLSRCLILLPFLIAYGPSVSAEWLYVLVAVLQLILLSMGIGLVLAAFVVRWNDVDQIWAMMTQLLFWLTPIMYTAQRHIAIEDGSAFSGIVAFLNAFVLSQPLSLILTDIRNSVLYSTQVGAPSVVQVISITIATLVFAMLAWLIYTRRSRFFLEQY